MDRAASSARAHQANVADAPSDSHLTMSISVVIPTMNEEQNIGWVLERLDPIVDEVIVVDGLSTDKTVAMARTVRPDVVIIEHRVRGKGEAVRAGLAAATGDLVVMLDADGSMDPAEIPQFVEALAEGADLVKGSRFLPGGGTTDMTLLRRIGNGALLMLTNTLLGTSYTELCYGYMAFRRSRLHELGLRRPGFEIETEIVVKAHRAGFAVVEIPSFESPRRFGVSNLNTFGDGWRILRTLLSERLADATPATTGAPASADAESAE